MFSKKSAAAEPSAPPPPIRVDRIEIKRGNIAYNNSPVYEPRLDVLTERVIEDANITVGLEITGLASRPRTRVVSNPAMSDSDALSWLLFGRPITQVSAGQANSINARSMALNAGGSVLVGTLGRQIGLDQASISDSRALGGSTLTTRPSNRPSRSNGVSSDRSSMISSVGNSASRMTTSPVSWRNSSGRCA